MSSTKSNKVAKNTLTAQHIGMMNGNNDRIAVPSRGRHSTADAGAVEATRKAHEHMAAEFEEEARQRDADALRKRYLAERADALADGNIAAVLDLDAEYERASRKDIEDHKKIGGES